MTPESVMVHHGLDRMLVLDWLHGDAEDREFYISLIRQVVPGFMNRRMRYAMLWSAFINVPPYVLPGKDYVYHPVRFNT